jgi:hypothetical protein
LVLYLLSACLANPFEQQKNNDHLVEQESEPLSNTSQPTVFEMPIPAHDSFKLVIFRENLYDDSYMPTEAQDAFPLIAGFEESQSLFVITLTEIELYNWELQTIKLTKDATKKLSTALENEEIPEQTKANMALEIIKNTQEEMGLGNPIERDLFTKAFSVKVNDKVLYSGIFYGAISPVNLDYPVIRLSIVDGRAILFLMPVHIEDVMIDPVDEFGNPRGVVISEDSVRYGQDLDEFSLKIITVNSTSDDAIKFRALIRNARIKEILEATNKLQE